MDVDLRDRGIARLCFSAEETSDEEAAVAGAVAVLLGDHNQIQQVRGLSAVFVNLVELRLAHNQLGRASTPYYRVDHSALEGSRGRCCCGGAATWIDALPATLEVLDVSHNHLHTFLECTCSDGGAEGLPQQSTAGPSASTEAERLLREERHRSPFAIALFFPAARFPALRELHLSHNAFAVSLRESDEMQARFDDCCPALLERVPIAAASTSATLTLVDLSFNQGVAAVNAFLLSPPRPAEAETTAGVACTMNVSHTAIEDLQAISAMSLYQPTTRWSLLLHPTPVSRSVLAAPPLVLHDLLQMVVATLGDAETVSALTSSADQTSTESLLSLLEDKAAVPALFLEQLEDAVQETLQQQQQQRRGQVSAAVPVVGGDMGEQSVARLLYASLLHQVVPLLDSVDGALSVADAEQLLVTSLLRLVQAVAPSQPLPPPPRRLPMGAAPPLHPPTAASYTTATAPPLRGLGSAASAVAPELRSRVVVSGGGAHADPAEMATLPSLSAPAPASPIIPAAAGGGGEGGARPGRFQAALAALRPSRSASATTQSSAASSAASSVGEDGAGAAAAASTHADGGEDFFTPTRLRGDDRCQYEALCREAAELQAAVLASNERGREFRRQCDALRQQLTQDRGLVADQGREVARLRAERAQLAESVERQRRRLEKRQKEVAYGVTAIESREAAARERAAMARVVARERAVAKKERQLRQQAARAGALAVEFYGEGPAGQRRKLRSEVLREAAVRRRLAEQENRDPFAYAPAPFKSDARRSAPRTTPDAKAEALAMTAAAISEEERAYFGLYGSLSAAPALQDAADTYVAHLPAPQQHQLREASAHLPLEGRCGSSARRRASSPAGGSPLSDRDAAPAGPNVVALGASPDTGRDLSSLSLSELLDAAAAIRQKQLALQQLHQQWRQPPPSPPTQTAPAQQKRNALSAAAAASEEEKGEDEEETYAVQTSLPDASGLTAAASAVHGERRTAGANSPFRSALSEGEAPPPPPPQPRSPQQLFDMMLAQRASPQPYGTSGDKGVDGPALLTRSPFSAQQIEEAPAGEDSSGNGVTTEGADDTSRSVSAGRAPQINRALFH